MVFWISLGAATGKTLSSARAADAQWSWHLSVHGDGYTGCSKRDVGLTHVIQSALDLEESTAILLTDDSLA